MRRLASSLVAASLLVVASCSADDRSGSDPIDSASTHSTGNTVSSPGAPAPGVTSPATGSPGASSTPPVSSPQARQRAMAQSAVDEALKALTRQPVVTYSSRLSRPASERDQNNDNDSAPVRLGRVRVVATSTGLVHGGGSVRGEPLELLTIDAKLYMRMGPAHWRGLGVDAATARAFATGWTVTSPEDVGFDPRRRMRPSAMAERLTVADGELSYRIVRQADGTPVYRVGVRGGTIDVTVRRPHRVTRTTVPIWDELTTGGVSGTLKLGSRALTFLREPSAPEFRYTREVLKGQRSGLRASLLWAPSLRIEVPEVAELSCSQRGRCTITARVTNRVKREFVPVSSVQVLLRAYLDGGPLGSKRCSAEGLAVVNAAASVSCSVEFGVPTEGRPYEIAGRVLATGFARWDPNATTISRRLQRHATETLRALAERRRGR